MLNISFEKYIKLFFFLIKNKMLKIKDLKYPQRVPKSYFNKISVNYIELQI